MQTTTTVTTRDTARPVQDQSLVGYCAIVDFHLQLVMGHSGSKPSVHQVVRESGGSVVLEHSSPPGTIDFLADESYSVSFGIDHQSSPSFQHKTLSAIAGRDATHVSVAAQKACEWLLCFMLCIHQIHLH